MMKNPKTNHSKVKLPTPTMLCSIVGENQNPKHFAIIDGKATVIDGFTFTFYVSVFPNPRTTREELQDGIILRIYPK